MKALTERQFSSRINGSIHCTSVITYQQAFASLLHRHLWPLTPSFPVHWAHNNDLSLWHTNSCVGGSEQSADYYLPWLIDNRLQKTPLVRAGEEERNAPVTDTRHPEPKPWLHKQHIECITGNNVCEMKTFYSNQLVIKKYSRVQNPVNAEIEKLHVSIDLKLQTFSKLHFIFFPYKNTAASFFWHV